MLHELLLALKGHYGGIFGYNDDRIKVVAGIPFIQTSEEAVLNQLCRLGTYYKDFRDFIQLYGAGLFAKQKPDTEDLFGLYLKSLCDGLDSVLEDYRQVLLQIEQDILLDAHLPLSHISYRLTEFYLLFPVISTVIDQIESHKAHGCYILDILYKNSITGIPVVKSALNRILHICHGLLFKQLSSWLLHGITCDPYQEFFIQPSKSAAAPPGGPRADRADKSSHSQLLNQTGKSTHSQLFNQTGKSTHSQLLNQTGTSTLSQHLGLMDIAGLQLLEKDEHTDSNQFCVSADLLPSYIPTRVAHKILFVGESVRMFEQDGFKTQSTSKGAIMGPKEIEFAGDLQKMSKQQEFNMVGFETLIDKIRAHAAEYLWVLVCEKSGLVGELRVLKDFFLLGRGELFLAFIDQAQHLLRVPPISTTEHDINQAFQHAARNVLIDNDALLQRFYLTVSASPRERKKAESDVPQEAESGWNLLGLTYTVQWPHHIFFSPAMLSRYNHLFCFLLAVRRTQLDLQHCWSLQMYKKAAFVSPAAGSTWQLRTHMAFLVDNLQYYLQVDVIESQYKILLDKIHTTKDFEAAKIAHEHFLASLLAQSFIQMRPVLSCLHEILNQCTMFCRLLVAVENPMNDRETQQLNTISLNFRRNAGLLFRILSDVRSQSGKPHLAQLLLRLDFNKFFTNFGGQFGRT